MLLVFWATWCKPCQLEMPHLSALQDDLGPKGLTVVGVSLDDATTTADVRAFVRSHRAEMRYVVGLDPEGSVAALYNPEHALPLSVVIDRRGYIREVKRGYVPGDEVALREKLEALVAEAPGGASPSAEEDALSWTISGQTHVERSEDDELSAGFQRTRVEATSDTVSATVRYDLELVHGPLPGGEGGSPQTLCFRGRPGFSQVRWSPTRNLTLLGGDSFVLLGRGLLLNLKSVGALGVETTLLGAGAEADAGPVSARLMGGVTHFSETPQALQGRCTEIFNPLVVGEIGVTVGAFGVSAFGLHAGQESAAGANDVFELDTESVATGYRGAGLSAQGELPGEAHIYVEGVALQPTDSDVEGGGLYASLDVPMGPVELAFEAKRYKRLALTYVKRVKGDVAFNALLPYSLGPTLEPIGLVFKDAPDQGDTTAGRVAARAAVGRGWQVLGSYLNGVQRGDEGLAHAQAGLQWSGDDSRTGLNLGHRIEDRGTTDAGPNPASGTWLHAEWDAAPPCLGRHCFEIQAEVKQFRPESGAQGEVKTDMLYVAVYQLAPAFDLAMVLDRRGNKPPEAEAGNHLSGQVTWRPASAAAVSLFAGSDPGGLRCTSGVCRVLPPFRGARLEASFRY